MSNRYRSILNVLSAPSSSLNTNLIGSWNANGDATDSTGSNDGTLTNGATASGTAKIGSNSFALNGVNSYVSFPNNSWNYTGDFSASCWINTNGLAGYDVILQNFEYIGGNFYGWQLMLSGGKPLLVIYFGTGAAEVALSSLGTLTVSTWYHVAFTKKINGDLNLYVNGALAKNTVSTTNIVYNVGNNYSTIGVQKYNIGVTYFFDGLIDAVAIWDKELTTDEITELYNAGTGIETPY